MQTQPRPPARSTRQGYLYVAVMMTAAIVSVIGFSAIGIARVSLQRTVRANEGADARALARTAVEDAVKKVNDNPTWRTFYTHDTEYPSPALALNGGTFTWKLVDDDGNLTDDATDSVWIHGIGRKGDAVYVEKVQLQANGPGLTCLSANLAVQGDLFLGPYDVFKTDQHVHSNGNVTATTSGAQIDGDARAVGAVNGNVTGSSTPGVTPLVFPGSSVFEYYKSNGTWIDVDDLPGAGSNTPTIEMVALGPGHNPFGPGAGNAEGIYVIDCKGKTLTIQNCRILGTLVLLNPSVSSKISGSVNWSRHVSNYPAVLVDGSMKLEISTVSLSEVLALKNFNPPGVPDNGVEDGDALDLYPSRVKGLVYVSGTMTFGSGASNSRTEGPVICGAMLSNSSCEFLHRTTYLNYPPPGFRDGTAMAIAPGTWQRDVVSP